MLIQLRQEIEINFCMKAKKYSDTTYIKNYITKPRNSTQHHHQQVPKYNSDDQLKLRILFISISFFLKKHTIPNFLPIKKMDITVSMLERI